MAEDWFVKWDRPLYKCSFLGALINYLVPIEVDPQPITEIILKEDILGNIYSLLVTAIFAPISEELYFRGLLYPALGGE